ncbi:MAG: hypothetical protein IJY42_00695, partial [Clostridia bacterium]|nr:hypothetical protein [Clostridia bacterium]
ADSARYATRTLFTKDSTVSSKLKVLGRSTETDTGITMDWSAATVAFNADCEGDIRATFLASATVRFLVYVDGTVVNTLNIASGTNTYTLAQDLTAGTHHVRLVRTTRVEKGNVGQLAELQSLILNGSLGTKPADKAYMIEFLGDSVTAGVGTGVGNDGEAYAEHTFAYQSAMELGVDYSVIAVPGIGTLTGTDRHNKLGDNILNIYQSTSHYREEDLSYSPARQADLVVIGTNANDSGSADETAFKAQVRAIIEQAIAFNGTDTKFVWVFNMYTNRDTINGYVQEVFAEYGGEAAGFYTLEFYVDNSGADKHPTAASHDDYTELLVNLIESKNILG